MSLQLEDLQYSDIYLVDQIFKGRIQKGFKVLDLGCGNGRNLIPFAQMGCDLFGVDYNPQAIESCKSVFGVLHPDQFFCGDITEHPYQVGHFDLVICNALFHFADDKTMFQRWANIAWEALKPGGLFFARLSTTIGLPEASPPGFTFIANETDLKECEALWGARRIDPLKTTLVESSRTMTTWVLQKT